MNIFFKVFFIVCVCNNLVSNAQILDEYPQNQDFYKGGLTSLYSKIHEISVKRNLQTCSNKNEIYHAKVLVTKDNKLKFIKDFDTLSINKNKCAYDFTMSVLRDLKDDANWQAAMVNNQKYDAVARLFFVPNHIINYKQNYTPYQYYIPPVYKGGVKKQQKDIHDNFMAIFADFHVNGGFILDFVIDENGGIQNPILTPEINNADFRQRIFQSLKRLNKKWNPAVLDGVNVKARMSIPLKFSVNFHER